MKYLTKYYGLELQNLSIKRAGGRKITESFDEFVPYVFAYNLLEDKTGQMIDEKLNGLTFKEFQRYWPSIIM